MKTLIVSMVICVLANTLRTVYRPDRNVNERSIVYIISTTGKGWMAAKKMLRNELDNFSVAVFDAN